MGSCVASMPQMGLACLSQKQMQHAPMGCNGISTTMWTVSSRCSNSTAASQSRSSSNQTRFPTWQPTWRTHGVGVATQNAYVEGIKYAIDAFAQRAPRAALYLDAGHGGWLGWPDKADNFFEVVARMGATASKLARLRHKCRELPEPRPALPGSSLCRELAAAWTAVLLAERRRRVLPRPMRTFCKVQQCNSEHNYVQLLAARARRSSLHTLLSGSSLHH